MALAVVLRRKLAVAHSPR